MKALLLSLAVVTSFPALAHNLCDGEAADCADAHMNFMCGGHVTSSVESAPNVYDTEVLETCRDGGMTEVSVQVKWDGLSCTCTRVSAPGDGG